MLNKYKNEDIKRMKNLKLMTDEHSRNIKINPTKYRSLIGNLLYLSISIRPDILYSVSRAARNSQDPNLEDWNNALKILGYLKETINYGLKFTQSQTINAYSDSDYTGDSKTRRSTSGYIITMGTTPICWSSKLQHCVSTSTAEAEYYSLSECAKQCMWYKSMLNELNYNIKTINVNVDNKATIFIGNNNMVNQKTKHIDIRYHYIRELIENKELNLKYMKSHDNLADGFTKYLNNSLMTNFRNKILCKFE